MNGKPYSADETAMLVRLFPDTPTARIASVMGRSISSINGAAYKLGLQKSEQYRASPAACRLRRGDNVGAPYRFPPGHVPANKGLRRPGWGPGRMKTTQFKKGERPMTWKPIGSTRLCDGYLQRKVTDTGYSPRDWQSVHVLLWTEQYGVIPPGFAIAFLDGNKQNIALNNLVMLSRADLMTRNTIHRYPTELKQAIRLVGKLNRTIEKATS